MKVYVVVAGGGEHADVWKSNVCACLTEEAAHLRVNELKQQSERLQKILPSVKSTFNKVIEPASKRMEKVPPAPSRTWWVNQEGKESYDEALLKWRNVALPIMQRNSLIDQEATQFAVTEARNVAIKLGCSDNDLLVLGFSGNTFSQHASSLGDYFYYEELICLEQK